MGGLGRRGRGWGVGLAVCVLVLRGGGWEEGVAGCEGGVGVVGGWRVPGVEAHPGEYPRRGRRGGGGGGGVCSIRFWGVWGWRFSLL